MNIPFLFCVSPKAFVNSHFLCNGPIRYTFLRMFHGSRTLAVLCPSVLGSFKTSTLAQRGRYDYKSYTCTDMNASISQLMVRPLCNDYDQSINEAGEKFHIFAICLKLKKNCDKKRTCEFSFLFRIIQIKQLTHCDKYISSPPIFQISGIPAVYINMIDIFLLQPHVSLYLAPVYTLCSI